MMKNGRPALLLIGESPIKIVENWLEELTELAPVP